MTTISACHALRSGAGSTTMPAALLEACKASAPWAVDDLVDDS